MGGSVPLRFRTVNNRANYSDFSAAGAEGAGAGQVDQLLGEGLDFLGLGAGGLDLPVLEQALHQAAAERDAVLGVAAQLAAADHVTAHGIPLRGLRVALPLGSRLN